MNLSALTIYIRKYGLLFIALIFLVFLIFIFFNKPTPVFNFNKALVYQKIGPVSGSYNPLGYKINSFSNTTFYSRVTNGEIEYFEVSSGNTTGYFINKGNYLGQYKNNPLYLGYALSHDIFNISVPSLEQGNLNYDTYLLNHFDSIPSYLMSKKIYTYLSLNLKSFYSASPILKSINIRSYTEGDQYNILYSYNLSPLLAQGGVKYFNKNIDIIVTRKSGNWVITSIKIL
jgi:hypothetical protein